MPSRYEIGEGFHDIQLQFDENWALDNYNYNQSQNFTSAYDAVTDYWDNVFGDYLGTESSAVNPLTSYFVNPEFWGPQVNLDEGEVYRAQEMGNISQDLLAGSYSSSVRPEASKRIGSTGFASSGINFGTQDLYSQFLDDSAEIKQESDAALGDVYEGYGAMVEGVMGGLASSGGFSADFAGGEEGDPYGDFDDSYDWSQYGFREDFSGGLEDCVQAALSTGVDTSNARLPGWDDFAGIPDYAPGTSYYGRYTDVSPNAMMDAVDYCKSIGGV